LPDGSFVSLFEFTWASDYTGASGNVYQYGSNIFDDGSGTGGVTILSETYFPTGAVPEPSTWAMMIVGFLGLGWLAYRRKNGTTLAPPNPSSIDVNGEHTAWRCFCFAIKSRVGVDLVFIP
jgi:hypothetical protein